MGVFDEHGRGYRESVEERCKRDYEKEIATLQNDIKTTEGLRIALLEYIDAHGRGNKTFTLGQLYGDLVLDTLQLSKTMARLQEQWEQEK